MGYNNNVLGSVVYNVYLKNGAGLTKVATVKDGSAKVKLPSTSSPTYVIKASYSNFAGAESTGTEVKVDYQGSSASDATVTLNGEASINLTLGSKYTDKGVTVTLDGEDITNDCKITPKVMLNSTIPSSLSEIGSAAGTYTITYTITYEGENISDKTISRTINVS